MIAPLVAALTFLNQSRRRAKGMRRELSKEEKKEIEKIDQMGLFEAIDYLSSRDTEAGFQGENKGDGLSGFRG